MNRTEDSVPQWYLRPIARPAPRANVRLAASGEVAVAGFQPGGLEMSTHMAARTSTSVDEDTVIAREAYIYGFPLVDQYRVMYARSVNMGSPQYKGPLNTLLNGAGLFAPGDKAFTTPNADVPYTFAGLDLRREPLVLSLPKVEQNRYYVFQLRDLYALDVAVLGTRTTGNGGGTFLIAGPDWRGEVPQSVTHLIAAETEFVSVIGRTQPFDPEDVDTVRSIQAEYALRPLSMYLGEAAPRAVPDINWWPPLRAPDQRRSLEFFNGLNFVLQFCPAQPNEREIRDRFAEIGIVPGRPFGVALLSDEMKHALLDGMTDGQKVIDERRAKGDWNTSDVFATREIPKDDYVARAAGTQLGIGANSKEWRVTNDEI